MAINVTFRLVGFRPVTLAIFALLGLVAILMGVILVTGDNPPLLIAFGVFWFAEYAWNAYWFLGRVAYEIRVVDSSMLGWRTITTSREAPLVLVRGINTPFLSPFGSGLRRIEVEGQPSPLLLVAPGLDEVVAMIVDFRPDLVVRTTWLDRLAQRFSRRTFRWKRFVS